MTFSRFGLGSVRAMARATGAVSVAANAIIGNDNRSSDLMTCGRAVPVGGLTGPEHEKGRHRG